MQREGAETGRLAAEGLACLRGGRWVFRGLGLALAPGGLLLLTGPNGSGKSSLLRLLAGLLAPAEGSLTWNGAPIAEDLAAHRARLAYLGHLDGVKTLLTGRENLAFWAGLAELGPDESRAAVERALAAFGLAPQADLPVRFLSAGQRRRLALARLLLAPRALWLLDEPTLGLDSASLERLVQAIERQRGDGGGVVIATHAALPLAGTTVLDLAGFRALAAEQAELAW